MIKFKAGYKYQLAEAYAVQTGVVGFSVNTDFIILDPSGNMVIRKGYAWDGATGFPDIIEVMEASLVHDAGYQLIRMGLISERTGKKWDKLFTKIVSDVCKRLHHPHKLEEVLTDILGAGVEYFGFVGLGAEREVRTTP